MNGLLNNWIYGTRPNHTNEISAAMDSTRSDAWLGPRSARPIPRVRYAYDFPADEQASQDSINDHR
jgi:hypothetical protein